jgi:hypothetical protein
MVLDMKLNTFLLIICPAFPRIKADSKFLRINKVAFYFMISLHMIINMAGAIGH